MQTFNWTLGQLELGFQNGLAVFGPASFQGKPNDLFLTKANIL